MPFSRPHCGCLLSQLASSQPEPLSRHRQGSVPAKCVQKSTVVASAQLLRPHRCRLISYCHWLHCSESIGIGQLPRGESTEQAMPQHVQLTLTRMLSLKHMSLQGTECHFSTLTFMLSFKHMSLQETATPCFFFCRGRVVSFVCTVKAALSARNART